MLGEKTYIFLVTCRQVTKTPILIIHSNILASFCRGKLPIACGQNERICLVFVYITYLKIQVTQQLYMPPVRVTYMKL